MSNETQADFNENPRLGALGVVLGAGSWDASLAAVSDLEAAGYSTIWLSGAQLDTLDRITEVVRATSHVYVGTAVIAADQFSADAGNVPPHRRILSALGPRMLELAGERTAGAVPVLATPDYTAQARAHLGPNARLIVQQLVVPKRDSDQARGAAREIIGFLRNVEVGYLRHFRRMGFTNDEIAELADRFVDGLVAWGDIESIRARVAQHRAAGADQVALWIPSEGSSAPTSQWLELAQELAT